VGVDLPAFIEGWQPAVGGPAARSGTRRDRLRALTEGVHLALERRVVAAGCYASPGAYARHLRAMLPLQLSLESWLDSAGAAGLVPDWPQRRKAALILEDLRHLGLQTTTQALPPPAIAGGRGAVLGVLYVTEGQTLGGAVLARRMAALGLSRAAGASFLDAYGAERGAMWQRFLAALEGAALSPAEEEALGPAALATFAAFSARIGGGA
jgi:heme oxygenase